MQFQGFDWYMVYGPLYHAQEVATIKLSFGSSCIVKSARSVGCEMIIANLVLHISLTIYHLLSNMRLWNIIVKQMTFILEFFSY